MRILFINVSVHAVSFPGTRDLSGRTLRVSRDAATNVRVGGGGSEDGRRRGRGWWFPEGFGGRNPGQ